MTGQASGSQGARRLRLVVVTTSFPNDVDDAAGCFVEAAAAEAAAHGAEVHVIAPGRRFRWRSEPRGRLAIHWAGGGSLFGWPGASARLRQAPWRLAGLGAFAAGARIHLARLPLPRRLVAHWLVPTAWPLLVGVGGPLELVAHGADVRLLLALPPRIRAALVTALVRRGAEVRFVADEPRARLLRALPSGVAAGLAARSWVEPLPLGLPDAATIGAAAARMRERIGPQGQGSVVACVGRLVGPKRVDLAIRAMAECALPVHLLVVGDGPARRELDSLARRLKVEAHFVGQLPRSAALGAMVAAAVVVHPSGAEAAPTVVREARALGVPVVACAAGDLARWAETDPGIQIAAADPAGLARCLERALGTPAVPPAGDVAIDPGLRPVAVRGHARTSRRRIQG